ncbi:short-chain dehydrogenase protein [Rutstroemia sp. NJR-2017a BVV2]|nr:short-chain dehydrogenase protein [Rutstroemia sp. NJR-2017a BVV2]
MATGTVLITGANGSLGIPAVKYLLTHYANYTALLTVRNPSDGNTEKLRAALSTFPKERYSIHQLDLGGLSGVKDFVEEIKGEIATGKIAPLAAIICNAYTWSIINGLKFTVDDYESSMAVNHLAHLKLVLGLLDSFGPEHGKIVVLGSDSHYPGKSGLEQFPPHIPEDLDLLVKPGLDKEGEEVGRGFQRYGLSKAVAIMCAYQLQKRLKKVQ